MNKQVVIEYYSAVKWDDLLIHGTREYIWVPRIYAITFHLYDVQEQAKLTKSSGYQSTGHLWEEDW